MATIAAEDVDVDFLPAIYDIIKCIERETNEAAQNKRSEYQDSGQAILEFQRKLEFTREQIRKLSGIDYSKEDQLKKLEGLRKHCLRKKMLLEKYESLQKENFPTG